MTCARSTARAEETTYGLKAIAALSVMYCLLSAAICLAYALGLANKLWNPHHPTRSSPTARHLNKMDYGARVRCTRSSAMQK